MLYLTYIGEKWSNSRTMFLTAQRKKGSALMLRKGYSGFCVGFRSPRAPSAASLGMLLPRS